MGGNEKRVVLTFDNRPLPKFDRSEPSEVQYKERTEKKFYLFHQLLVLKYKFRFVRVQESSRGVYSPFITEL